MLVSIIGSDAVSKESDNASIYISIYLIKKYDGRTQWKTIHEVIDILCI